MKYSGVRQISLVLTENGTLITLITQIIAD